MLRRYRKVLLAMVSVVLLGAGVGFVVVDALQKGLICLFLGVVAGVLAFLDSAR
jgi:hypothetical protein